MLRGFGAMLVIAIPWSLIAAAPAAHATPAGEAAPATLVSACDVETTTATISPGLTTSPAKQVLSFAGAALTNCTVGTGGTVTGSLTFKVASCVATTLGGPGLTGKGKGTLTITWSDDGETSTEHVTAAPSARLQAGALSLHGTVTSGRYMGDKLRASEMLIYQRGSATCGSAPLSSGFTVTAGNGIK